MEIEVENTHGNGVDAEQAPVARGEQRNVVPPIPTRLPRSNGHWEGEVGNSLWHSDIRAVKKLQMAKEFHL